MLSIYKLLKYLFKKQKEVYAKLWFSFSSKELKEETVK